MKVRLAKLGFTALKYAIISIIAILLFHIAKDFYNDFRSKDVEPVRYSEDYEGVINESEYIISEQMILNKLQMKSEIVSMEQDLYKKEKHTDRRLTGKRETELEVKGKYKMGLNTNDIEISHIDHNSKTIYINLPNPILISLEMSYNDVRFDKRKGFFRRKMSQDKMEEFYKIVEENIVYELNNNEEILERADLYNRKAVEDIVLSLSDIDSVVFK